MLRCLLLLFLTAAAGSIAQTDAEKIRLTDPYPMPPGSTPLALLNTASPYFYFLRYNKLAHDVTLEKRRKSDGSFAGFTAMRLDSVNAAWFDYSLLDQVLFERDGLLFYVFRRVLNKKITLYMKQIDTTCRTSGFIELASLETDKKETAIELGFSVTNDKQLLVIKSRVYGFTVRKEVSLIDPLTRTTVRQYSLPMENPATGFSREMAVDRSGKLFYLLYRFHNSISFGSQVEYGELVHNGQRVDSLFLVEIDSGGSFAGQRIIDLPRCDYIDAAWLWCDSAGVKASCLYTITDNRDEHHLQTMALTVHRQTGSQDVDVFPADSSLRKRLTFYDGSDDKSPGGKSYDKAMALRSGTNTYFLAERRSPDHFKEMLGWCVNAQGRVISFSLIPRKTFYFTNRTRHKSFGEAMHTASAGNLITFVLEHPGNRSVMPTQFVNRRFRRLESEWRAALAAYVMQPGGHIAKKVLWYNTDYACIPLTYEGPPDDAVLYFVRGERERFGVVKLSQL